MSKPKDKHTPLERLKHHVSGAIERGEATAIEAKVAPKRERTETQVRRELRALLASANERIGEGHYGIAESCLKQALTFLDEASDIKLRGES